MTLKELRLRGFRVLGLEQVNRRNVYVSVIYYLLPGVYLFLSGDLSFLG